MSAAEGRLHGAAERRAWMGEAGLTIEGPLPALAHSGLLLGSKTA